jgi:protein TonB
MPRSVAPTQNGPQQPVSVTGGSNGFNYPWYVSLIQRKVSQAWYTQEVDPHTPYGSQVRVTFSISRDGTPSNIKIEQSSGSPTLDSSGLRAVQRVENFSPLPSGYSKSSVSVEYTFTYKLSQH